MVSSYRLSAHWPIFSLIGISCTVTDTANSEFNMHIFDLLSCVGHFPFSSLCYETVQDQLAHSVSFEVTELGL